MYTYLARLDRVVDGDTVDIIIDLGFSVTTKQRVRLQGINAPEHNTEAGQKALRYVREWFENHDATFMVDSAKPGAGDKYGRYLATIRVAFGTTTLNSDLVNNGYAKPWDGQGAKPV